MTPDTWVTEGAGCKFKASLGVLVVVYCPDKYHNQKNQLGRRKELISCYSLHPFRKGCYGRNSRQGPASRKCSRDHGGMLLDPSFAQPILFVCLFSFYLHLYFEIKI